MGLSRTTLSQIVDDLVRVHVDNFPGPLVMDQEMHRSLRHLIQAGNYGASWPDLWIHGRVPENHLLILGVAQDSVDYGECKGLIEAALENPVVGEVVSHEALSEGRGYIGRTLLVRYA